MELLVERRAQQSKQSNASIGYLSGKRAMFCLIVCFVKRCHWLLLWGRSFRAYVCFLDHRTNIHIKAIWRTVNFRWDTTNSNRVLFTVLICFTRNKTYIIGLQYSGLERAWKTVAEGIGWQKLFFFRRITDTAKDQAELNTYRLGASGYWIDNYFIQTTSIMFLVAILSKTG